MKKILVMLLLVLLIAGCSSGGSEITDIKASDLCVTHINFDSKICYGDDKKKVEAITGEGKEEMKITFYDNDISIFYRNDTVAAISLGEESLDVYKTDYAKIGDSKKSILDNLGSKNANNNAPSNLDYIYDSQTKEFTLDTPKPKETAEEMEQVYQLSFRFNADGNTENIMLLDQRMAIFTQ